MKEIKGTILVTFSGTGLKNPASRIPGLCLREPIQQLSQCCYTIYPPISTSIAQSQLISMTECSRISTAELGLSSR